MNNRELVDLASYKINQYYNELYKKISTYNKTELGKLNDISYRGDSIALINGMMAQTGITKDELSQLKKTYFKQYGFQNLLKDTKLQFLILLLYVTSKNDDEVFVRNIILLIIIRFYNNLMIKNVKYLDKTVQMQQLEKLSHLHGFSKYGISKFLYSLQLQIEQRYKDQLEKFEPKAVVNLIYEARHRVSQSVKAFQKQYYDIKSGVSVSKAGVEKTNIKLQTSVQLQFDNVISDFNDQFLLYKQIDNNAINKQNQYTKISKLFIKSIIKSIQQVTTSEEISKIFYSFLNDMNNDYASFMEPKLQVVGIQKQMQVKNIKKTEYSKKIVYALVDKQINDNEKAKITYDRLSQSTKHKVNLQIAYYLYFALVATISHT